MDVPSPTLAAMYNALKNGENTQEHLFDFKEVAEVNLVELHLIIILGMRLENAEINVGCECARGHVQLRSPPAARRA